MFGASAMLCDKNPDYRHMILTSSTLLEDFTLMAKYDIGIPPKVLIRMAHIVLDLCHDNPILEVGEKHETYAKQILSLLSFFLFKRRMTIPDAESRNNHGILIRFTCKAMTHLLEQGEPFRSRWVTRITDGGDILPILLSCIRDDAAFTWNEETLNDVLNVIGTLAAYDTRTAKMPVIQDTFITLFSYYSGQMTKVIMKTVVWCLSTVLDVSPEVIHTHPQLLTQLRTLFWTTSSLNVTLEILWCFSHLVTSTVGNAEEHLHPIKTCVYEHQLFTMLADALQKKDVDLCIKSLELTMAILHRDDPDGNFMSQMEEDGILRWVQDVGMMHACPDVRVLADELWNEYGEKEVMFTF
jgi:hypothetical protein